MATVMEKECGVTKAAAGAPEENGVKKAVGAPEEVTLAEPENEPQGKCYKKTVGEEATFMETAKDIFTQFKEKPARAHWTCIMDRVRSAGEYVSQKSSSVRPLPLPAPLLSALLRSLFRDARRAVWFVLVGDDATRAESRVMVFLFCL
jgi:hypothetical protein